MRGFEKLTVVNANVVPKRYFPFVSVDDTVQSLKKPLKSNAQVILGGVFNENIADSFYNERLELGERFTFRIPAPFMKWHPAKQGTVAKFHGCLNRIYPELGKISDKDLDTLIRNMRNKEE